MSTMRGKRGEGGSILILALWSLFFLAALALSVGAYVSGSLSVAGSVKGLTSAGLLARSGAENAAAQVMRDTNGWDGADEFWSDDEEAFGPRRLVSGSFSVMRPSAVRADPDSARDSREFGLEDEERRVNVNKASQSLLCALMETAGGADSMAASGIAAAVLDWRDPDDEPLTGGAENEYYTRLIEPYSCRNGEMQSAHELLLVKGMTPELFARIEPCVTVFGSGKVNLNTADRAVLTALARSRGASRAECDGLVAALEGFRKAGHAFEEPGGAAIMGTLREQVELDAGSARLFGEILGSGQATIRSTCFRGLSIGRAGGGPGAGEGPVSCGKSAEFVVNREGSFLYWREY